MSFYLVLSEKYWARVHFIHGCLQSHACDKSSNSWFKIKIYKWFFKMHPPWFSILNTEMMMFLNCVKKIPSNMKCIPQTTFGLHVLYERYPQDRTWTPLHLYQHKCEHNCLHLMSICGSLWRIERAKLAIIIPTHWLYFMRVNLLKFHGVFTNTERTL